MDEAIAFIGFGEAGAAFAGGMRARGYDRKTGDRDLRAGKLADFAQAGVTACGSAAEALAGTGMVLSLVTADQALAAAETNAPLLEPETLWIDMNSVSPDTKRAAASAIERAGARYVDAAVMAPVLPRRRDTPILVAGPHRQQACAMLAGAGFTAVAAVDGPVGTASATKMIRSVLVKGLEALTAECFLAAAAAGVSDAVADTLDRDWPDAQWLGRADYNLERMMQHGVRRAAELDEVVRTLETLGTGSAMSRAAAIWQRRIGALALAPPAGLDAKIALIEAQARTTDMVAA